MKPNFTKFSLLLISIVLCVITCKTPANNKAEKKADNSWIEELTIEQLQNGYKEGKYTVKEVVKVYLDRIAELDKNGPRLNSVIVINPDALNIAENLEKESAAGKPKGPYMESR